MIDRWFPATPAARLARLAALALPLLLASHSALALPDLVVSDIDVSSLAYDQSDAHVSGIATVTIRNGGDAATTASRVLAFEDRDLDHAYSANGDTSLAEALVAPIPAGEEVNIEVAIDAALSFGQAPISFFADSRDAIREADERNNVASSLMTACNEEVVGTTDAHVKYAIDPVEVQFQHSTVMVTHLIDDTGDGLFDERDIPSLAFMCGAGLKIARADTGEIIWEHYYEPEERPTNPNEMAIGNLDSDASPEIVALFHTHARLIAYDLEGEFEWVSDEVDLPGSGTGAPCILIANLDLVGAPEVAVGATVFSNRGKLLAVPPPGGPQGEQVSQCGAVHSAIADIDLDGDLELVAGGTVYSFDGHALHVERQIEGLDGFVGLANFDEDSEAEIVVVSGWTNGWTGHTEIRLLDAPAGTDELLEVWAEPWTPPSGWEQGVDEMLSAPTIADLDGDGVPEILVSGSHRLGAIDVTGEILWDIPIASWRCGGTGATVFDLDGDGAPEVIQQDGVKFRILDGLDGAERWHYDIGASLGAKMPVVADVDADGHAEIVIATTASANRGEVRVFEGDGPEWMPARQTWNQNAYHVTNVNDDGSIPRRAAAPWSTPAGAPFNDWRVQHAPPGAPDCLPLPDLTASLVSLTEGPCSGEATLTVRVGNAGPAQAPPMVSVAFYSGDPVDGNPLGEPVSTTAPLDPGEYRDVSVVLDAADAIGAVWAVADDDGEGVGAVIEVSESNNGWHVDVPSPCPPLPEQHAPTLVASVASSGNYFDPIEVSATLTDGATPVQFVFIDFALAGATCRALTNEDGIAACLLTPVSADTTLSATSDETSVLDSATDEATFSLTLEQTTLTLSHAAVQRNASGTVTLSATLREDGGLPLEGKTVEFTLDAGSVGSDATDEDGLATVTVSATAGAHSVGSSFAATTEHAGASATSGSVALLLPQITLNPVASLDAAGTNRTLTAQILDDGTTRAGVEISFEILDGSPSDENEGDCGGPCETNGDGIVEWTYEGAATAGLDEIRAWIDLNEDETYDAGEPTAIAKVQQRVVVATTLTWSGSTWTEAQGPHSLAATLVDQDDDPIEGAAILFELEGETCVALTDSEGEAECWVTVTAEAATYTATATFSGDVTHEPSTVDEDIEVGLDETGLYTATWSPQAEGTITVSALLLEDHALPIVGKTVTFTVWGVSMGADCNPPCTDIEGEDTDEDGYYEAEVPDLAAGTYQIDADFAADDWFAASDMADAYITVSSMGTSQPPTYLEPTDPIIDSVTVLGDGAVRIDFTPGILPIPFGPPSPHYVTIVATSTKIACEAAVDSVTLSGLENGEVHEFTITAVNGMEESDASGSDEGEPVSVPRAPAPADADAGTTTVDVTWSVPTEDGGAEDPLTYQWIAVSVGDDEPTEELDWEFTSLTQGVPQIYRIRAENEVVTGYGPAIQTTAVVPFAPPSAPTSVAAIPSETSATVYWLAPADLHGVQVLAADGYEVKYYNGTTWSTPVAVAGTRVYRNFTGLTTGTPIYFQVRACNATGSCSDWSASSPTITPGAVPEAPDAPDVTPLNGAVSVEWDDPEDNGSAIIGYLVSVGTLPTLGPQLATDDDERAMTGLENGLGVMSKVRAVNAFGPGPESTASASVTPAREPERPEITGLNRVHDVVTIEWSAPSDDGGSDITGYIVTTSPPSGVYEVDDTVLEFTFDSETEPALVNGLEYVAFVQAANLEGSGSLSFASDPFTPAAAPTVPRGLTASIRGDRSIRIAWVAPETDGGSDILEYTLQAEDQYSEVEIDVDPGANARRYDATLSNSSLEAGDELDITLVAHNDEGQSPVASTTITVATFPSAPTITSVEEGDRDATVSWTALSGSGTGYADILSYRVCPIPGSAPCVDVPASITEATVTGLANGDEVRLEVRGRNVVGLGAPALSDPVTPCTTPYPALNVRAAVTDTEELTVTWEPPAWDGGCEVTGYWVRLGVGDFIDVGDVLTAVFDATDGLEACEEYTFEVKAENARGLSDASNPSTAVRAAEPPGPPASVVGYPGDNCAMACWQPPEEDGCSPVIEYEVTVDSEIIGTTDGETTCLYIPDLENGVPSTIEVRARNAANWGATEDGTVTPTAPTLDRISFEPGAIVGGDDSVAIVWLTGVAGEGGLPVELTTGTGEPAWPEETELTVAEGQRSVRVPVHSDAETDSVLFTATMTGSDDVTESLILTEPGDGRIVPCLFRITSPEDGAEVFDFGTGVEGTIDCESTALDRWELWLCPIWADAEEDADCVLVDEADGEILEGSFGAIDPTLLLNGEYEMRLRGYDGTGLFGTLRVPVSVTGQQKIGHFTMSFVDMTVPAAGMPIQVIRTYDSRDNRVGDFGVGWRLSFNDVRVEKSRPLNDRWEWLDEGEGTWPYTPRSCVEGERPHVVSVIFPDGRTYRFEAKFSTHENFTRACAQYAFDVETGWIRFDPMGGTRGTLAAVGGTHVSFDRSSGVMHEFDTDRISGEPPDTPEFDRAEFELTTEDGTLWRVEVGEGLSFAQDRNGNSVTIDAEGIHQEPSGKEVLVHRDGDGLVDYIEDPNGKRTHYTYTDLDEGSGELLTLWKFRDRTQPITGGSSRSSPTAMSRTTCWRRSRTRRAAAPR